MAITTQQWLQAVNAWPEIVAVGAQYPDFQAMWQNLARPDWLLWFLYQTGGGDLSEQRRVAGLLIPMMSGALTQNVSAAGAPIATPFIAAAEAWAGGGNQNLRKYAATFHSLTAVEDGTPQRHLNNLAAQCLAALATLCSTEKTTEATLKATSSAALTLGNQWRWLLQAAGTLPSDDITATKTVVDQFRAAVPLVIVPTSLPVAAT